MFSASATVCTVGAEASVGADKQRTQTLFKFQQNCFFTCSNFTPHGAHFPPAIFFSSRSGLSLCKLLITLIPHGPLADPVQNDSSGTAYVVCLESYVIMFYRHFHVCCWPVIRHWP
jgi:hypothetical protein